MAFQPTDDLRRAKDAVTIFQLWERAGLPGLLPTKDGMYKSPFRDEKTESFSITKHGKVWADFGGAGTVKGGVWEFAEKCPCWSQLDAAGIAKVLIEVSGIIPTPRPTAASPAAPGAAAPAAPEVDPRLLKAAKSIEKRAQAAARENAIYEEREQLLERPPQKPAVKWPECVRDRYLEGIGEMRARSRYIAEFAADRGWPEAWAWALVEQELVSLAWERAATPGKEWAKRQKAFAVLAPRFTAAGATSLEPVGYHQRFYVPARGDQKERKGWLYLPSLPKDHVRGGLGAPRSDYEREIIAAAQARGVVVDDVPSLVPPLPFVLGDLQAPRLIVLLEGQWDAITFFGACGWFHDTTPPQGVAVFGIRGAQGLDAFLGHWWPWLERHQPRAWVIADNDAAGGAWREAPEAEPGLLRPPSLAERLEAAGCRKPLVSWLKRGPWGKDFNDYFKARTKGGQPLSVEKMWAWMAKLGLVDANGGWV